MHAEPEPANATNIMAQASAAQAAGGVTAFARQRQQPRRVDLAELAELDAAVAAMESGSEGDLEDDFLLTATQVRADKTAPRMQPQGRPISGVLARQDCGSGPFSLHVQANVTVVARMTVACRAGSHISLTTKFPANLPYLLSPCSHCSCCAATGIACFEQARQCLHIALACTGAGG